MIRATFLRRLARAISRISVASNHPADAAEIAAETGLSVAEVREEASRLLAAGIINEFDYTERAND